jgi:hypothetical protein
MRDEQAIIKAKLNAENAAKTMIEKLIALNVSEQEIAAAIEHLKRQTNGESLRQRPNDRSPVEFGTA